jgi:2-polyprenyl-6-methoxyphenol hydroxylase-like FAD-dependent oxidoreductase
LLECAETLPNLEIQEGASVACSLEENPEVSIKNKVFHPKLLIGADGLHSRVRKLANLEATIPKLKRWGGVRQHFNVEHWNAFVEIHWGSGLEAYVTPVSETSINVSLLWGAKRYKPEHGGKKLICSMLNEFPELPGSLKKRRCSG